MPELLPVPASGRWREGRWRTRSRRRRDHERLCCVVAVDRRVRAEVDDAHLDRLGRRDVLDAFGPSTRGNARRRALAVVRRDEGIVGRRLLEQLLLPQRFGLTDQHRTQAGRRTTVGRTTSSYERG